MTRLAFPSVDRPALSVVMVTYGGWKWARQALEALIENTEPCYEIIVVDNGSPDEMTQRLRDDVDGAKVVFNPKNAGFAAGVNRGVCHATAPNLLLLNSDAMVQPGWLPPLFDVIESDPVAAAVVPMLLNLDGTLQEAGSLLGGDGNTLAWGSGDDSGALQYRFRRYIDYASAACMLVRRSALLSVGGLDPRYPVGYYEDVDMCLALAERGYRVVYQPRSKVMHVRWGSSDVEEAGRLMHANRPILLRRWGHELAGRPPLVDWQLPRFPHRVVAARDARARHRLLAIANGPGAGGDSGRTERLAATVAAQWPTCRTTLIDESASIPNDRLERLLDLGVEVVRGPEDWDAWLEARLFHYSAVLVGGATSFGRFAPILERHQPQALKVYDVGQTPGKRRMEDLDPSEIAAIRSGDVVLCASDDQRKLVRRIAPGVTSRVLEDDPRSVVEAIALLGMAPPDV